MSPARDPAGAGPVRLERRRGPRRGERPAAGQHSVGLARALFIPQDWGGDREGGRCAGIPERSPPHQAAPRPGAGAPQRG